jgi:hydrocephalus-inducing protein
LSFSHDAIDIGKIFVGSHHTYEIVISNGGEIDGRFFFDGSASRFGKSFEFAPVEGIVATRGYQVIQIGFASDILGSFEEHFEFSVESLGSTIFPHKFFPIF